jgi:hypothetical protein
MGRGKRIKTGTRMTRIYTDQGGSLLLALVGEDVYLKNDVYFQLLDYLMI